MNPGHPSEYSGSVALLQAIQWLGMHLHESVVCFHSLTGNLQVRQNSLNLGIRTLSGIFGGNTLGFSPDLDSNRWRRKSYALSQTHSGHSSAGKQSGSTVQGLR